jgi:hypothetical protein
MFRETWKKYAPVIAILVKRSVNGDQTLDMNRTDFERAAAGKKIKFTFNLRLREGKADSTVKFTPFVKEFIQFLQDDERIRGLIKGQNIEFTLNANFQLLIKNQSLTKVLPEPQETDDDRQ